MVWFMDVRIGDYDEVQCRYKLILILKLLSGRESMSRRFLLQSIGFWHNRFPNRTSFLAVEDKGNKNGLVLCIWLCGP